MIYITIECGMYNCLDAIKAWAPELHHGFTTQGQPQRLGHGLGHLIGDLRTCDGSRLPPGASPSCRRLSDEWMDRSSSLGAQEVVFMHLWSLGACSNLPCTRFS
jgi:hypothetical protein